MKEGQGADFMFVVKSGRAGAAVDAEVLAIDREALLAVVKKQPVFGLAMLCGFADRLRQVNSLLA